jgi:hypothetical protein
VDTYSAQDTEGFLARERAALGDDADLFATPNDHVTSSAMVGNANDDLLGGEESIPTQVPSKEISGFESSFPDIETQNQVRKVCICRHRKKLMDIYKQQTAPGGTITGTGASLPPTTVYTNYREPEEEPEVIR